MDRIKVKVKVRNVEQFLWYVSYQGLWSQSHINFQWTHLDSNIHIDGSWLQSSYSEAMMKNRNLERHGSLSMLNCLRYIHEKIDWTTRQIIQCRVAATYWVQNQKRHRILKRWVAVHPSVVRESIPDQGCLKYRLKTICICDYTVCILSVIFGFRLTHIFLQKDQITKWYVKHIYARLTRMVIIYVQS